MKVFFKWGSWASGLLMLCALVAIRMQMVSDMGLTIRQAFETGFWAGIFYDLAATIAIVATANFANLWKRSLGNTLYGLAMFVLWLVTMANGLHFRFFGVRLDWWVVKLHWRDFTAVQGSAAELGNTGLIWISTICFLIALPLRFFAHESQLPHRLAAFFETFRLRAPFYRLLFVSLLAALAALFNAIPRNWRKPAGHGIHAQQILRIWWHEWTTKKTRFAAQGVWMGSLPDDTSDLPLDEPTVDLAAYRDYRDGGPMLYAEATPLEDGHDLKSKDPAFPLVQDFQADAQLTQRLRQRLGLPATGPVHILTLFVESMRVYELLHPDLAPIIYPRLRGILEKHALWFTQTYSSSFNAGQTVRGQFSTLCSMLPNVLGAATYIAHTTLRVHCLQEQLKNAGYNTLWMNSYQSTFHSKRQFEILHGTQHFYDGDYYKSRGIHQVIGEWGLADGPFLLESLDVLKKQAAEAPVFANILTISTHHPYSVIPEGRLPAELMDATDGNTNYQGYLSRLRYADESLGNFLEAYLQSDLAKQSVLVLLGDHGSPALPHHSLTDAQKLEIQFRIPLAFIGPALTPEKIARPVHQVDIAPTLARIAGSSGEVSWIGTGLWSAQGRPWVYESGRAVHYRTANHACYTFRGGESLHCYDVSRNDPLFSTDVAGEPEDPERTSFFKRVLRADLAAQALNKILPSKLAN